MNQVTEWIGLLDQECAELQSAIDTLVAEQQQLQKQRRLYAELLKCYEASVTEDLGLMAVNVGQASSEMPDRPESTSAPEIGVLRTVEPMSDFESVGTTSANMVATPASTASNGSSPKPVNKGAELIGPRVRRQVREILVDAGGELSINEIHAEFLKRGFDVPGQGRPANITIHLSGSEEIISPARGLYRLQLSPTGGAELTAPVSTPPDELSSSTALVTMPSAPSTESDKVERSSNAKPSSKKSKKAQRRSHHGAKASSKKKARKRKRHHKQSR